MSLNQAFLRKLQYLFTVGYNQETIKACKEYWEEEDFDQEGVTDDLDDINDSQIIEHLQKEYALDDERKKDIFMKLRQALDIDPKQAKPPKPEIVANSEIDAINAGIGRYYERIGAKYADQFSIYCLESFVILILYLRIIYNIYNI